MECARRGFVFAFVGLVLMTIGFCLATAGWFTPPVVTSVLPIRLGGTVSFFVGLALLLGSCIVCAIRQRRCCRRCTADDGAADAFARGRKKRREEESGYRNPRGGGGHDHPSTATVPLMTTPAGPSGSDLPPTFVEATGSYDPSQNEARAAVGREGQRRGAPKPVTDRATSSTRISSNSRGILAVDAETRVTSEATSDVIRPNFETQIHSKRETEDDVMFVDPREFLYIAPQFGEENRLAKVHHPHPKTAPIRVEAIIRQDLPPSTARNSSSADPQLGDPRLGDPRLGDPRLGDPRLGDHRLGDPRQGDPRLGDPRIAKTRLGDPRLRDHRLGDHQLGDPRLGDPRLGDHQLGDPRLGDPRLGDPRIGDPRLGDPRLGDPRIGDLRLGDLRLGDPRIEDLRLGDHRLGDPRIGDHRLGELPLEDSRLGNPRQGDPRLGDQSVGIHSLASRAPPSSNGNRSKTADSGVKSNETETDRSRVEACRGEGRSFADLTLTLTSERRRRRPATGDLPAQVVDMEKNYSPRPPKRCRSCEDRYLLKVSQKTERGTPGTGAVAAVALPASSNGGIGRDLARRTRSHLDGPETAGAPPPPRASRQRLRHPGEERQDQRPRPGRSRAPPSCGQARGQTGGAGDGGGGPEERGAAAASKQEVSPVKYRRVLCPVHDRPKKPV